jgi:hypothetical protein
MTLFDLLYVFTFIVNISVTSGLLYAWMARNATLLLIAHSLYPSLFDKLVAVKFIVEVYARQWLQKNVTKISQSEYELTHVIDGELVRMRVKRVVPKIIDAQDCETEESVPQALPYASFRQIPWPNRPLIYYYEDGTRSE